ncbi:MAG: hypothetical protein ACT4QE_24845 [Anaerolineales bacterium]
MKRILLALTCAWSLILNGSGALAFGLLPAVAASSTQNTLASLPAGEAWRWSVTVDGSATHSALLGRGVSNVAHFQSARAADTYAVFPPLATPRQVTSAYVYLLSRSGTSGAAAPLALEVLNADGAVAYNLSTATLDLETATTGTWLPMSLTSGVNLLPGQHVVLHGQMTNAGTLNVLVLFEVNAQPGFYRTHLPLLRK